MKIESGMYVRTNGGYIYKLGYYNNEEKRWICVEETDWYPVYESEVLKASYDIGEILEAGDFLDFHRIEKIEGTTIFLADGWFIDFDDVEDLVGTICTKEQFESISYKVGE